MVLALNIGPAQVANVLQDDFRRLLWRDIAIDFISSLPCLNGYFLILVVNDLF